MKANLKTQQCKDFAEAAALVNELNSKGLENSSFPEPGTDAFTVVWSELSTNKQTLTITDWMFNEIPEEVAEDEKTEYQLNVEVGNQTYVDIIDSSTDEPVLGFVLEINKGVPSLHLDTDGGDCVIHLHKTPDGLVITPDNPSVMINQAESSKFTYEQNDSLIAQRY